jgi:hypothetical protein
MLLYNIITQDVITLSAFNLILGDDFIYNVYTNICVCMYKMSIQRNIYYYYTILKYII